MEYNVDRVICISLFDLEPHVRVRGVQRCRCYCIGFLFMSSEPLLKMESCLELQITKLPLT